LRKSLEAWGKKSDFMEDFELPENSDKKRNERLAEKV